MTKPVTKQQRFLARLVLVLIIGFTIAGLVWYGVSADERARLWQNLFERQDGPKTFRFFLQPTMGAIAAWRDGLADARAGRSPFLWGTVADPTVRLARMDEALVATARIILLGLVMDIIYQVMVFRAFFPVEAVLFALALAFVPYVLLRGPITRGIRWWWHRRQETTR